MHMADALLSPSVGGVFLAVSGGVLVYSARRLSREADEHRVPLMGVLGAFVFAAQMINFTIPGTGSSGHLGGGMLLAILLGPPAAFLVIASVLVVQALFFLDGGILALGTNIFNLGVWPCFLGILIYRRIAGARASSGRLWVATMVAVAVSLEWGALGVVAQTLLSHRVSLSFGHFALLMMGIHLPIAAVEGVVTAAVVQYVWAIRPGLVTATEISGPRSAGTGSEDAPEAGPSPKERYGPLLVSFLAMAILLGCVVAWFASPSPDGLEWSLSRTQKTENATVPGPLPALERLQKKLAVMPDYDFPNAGRGLSGASEEAASNSGGNVRVGTSVAGLIGTAMTAGLVLALGGLLYWLRSRGKVRSA